MSNKFPNISVEDFNFRQLVVEVLDMLTGKTKATEKRAILHEDLYPSSILTLDQAGVTPSNDPTQDFHIANKRYVDKINRRAFFHATAKEEAAAASSGADADAIHDNVSSEISAITEKLTPHNDDVLVIEDSEASNAKKSLKISNLPSGGAHKDSHDPEDGADALDTAAPAELASVQAAGAGSSHSLARADHAHQIQHSIADNHIVTMDDADAADNDYAKFTADGLEGRSYSEVRSDLNIADGADVTGSNAPQAHAASHENAGADEISVAGLSGLLADDQHVLDTEVSAVVTATKLDDLTTPDDNTDLNASTSAHGLCPKLDNVSTNFLNGQGSWSAPAPAAASCTMIVLSKSSTVSQNVGGVNGTEVWWTWDGEVRKDTGFTHSTSVNSNRIQVDADGDYLVQFMGNAQQTGSNRSTLLGIYRVNGGTTKRCGTIRDYSRGAAYGNMSPGLVDLVTLTNGDYIEVGTRVEDTDATYTITAPDGTEVTSEENRLIIELKP